MSGFPIRPSRTALGPKPENRKPTKNPKQEMDADLADLCFWQIAGMGRVSPFAWIFVPIVAGAVDTANIVHTEAWNPNQDQTAPTATRTGLGVYRIQYAATYPDKDGVAQNTNLTFGDPTPQGVGASGQPCFATCHKVDARTFDVKVWRKDTMAADDASVGVVFW